MAIIVFYLQEQQSTLTLTGLVSLAARSLNLSKR